MRTLLIIILTMNVVCAQVGINTGNTIDASVALEIESSSKGLLLPRLSSHTLINNPTNGLIIYDIEDQCINLYATQWVNLCNSNIGTSGALQCGSGYTTATIKKVETNGQSGQTLLVTEAGNLMLAGRLDRPLEGQSNLYNVDFNIIKGPWPSGSVITTDLAASSTTGAVSAIVGTTNGLYFQHTVNSTWTKSTTYSGGAIVNTEISLGEGMTVLDENGDVYFSPSVTDNFTKIAALDAPNIIDIDAGGGNGTSGGTTYQNIAWAANSNIMYYWETDPTAISTFTLPSAIVDIDCSGRFSHTVSPTLILLEDGSIYALGGSSYYGLSGTPTTPTLISLSPIDRTLESGEIPVKLGVGKGNASSYFITNLGNVYSYTTTSGWYHEYELKVSDPENAHISSPGNRGVQAQIDGQLVIWGASTGGTSYDSTTSSSTVAGSGANFRASMDISSPITLAICEPN